MILVIAGLREDVAPALPAGWSDGDCHIVRAADLSTPGWSHVLPADSGRAAFAVGGQVYRENAITGVLTRTAWISRYELPHIVATDRDYVAAEMSAFLLSWLHALACPVVNRPMPGCLAGPAWRPRQWTAAAAAAGLSIASASDETPVVPMKLTIVGTQCFGAAGAALREGSLQLARLAQVELLDVHFAGEAFVRADPFPALSDTAIAGAVRGLFDRPARRLASFPILRPWQAAQVPFESSRATASPIG